MKQVRAWIYNHSSFLVSFFLAYHVLAISIAPAPDSYLRRQIIPFFQPYLTLFRLGNHWAYFAPDPASGILLRYRLRGSDGKIYIFKLTEDLVRRDPNFSRLASLFSKLPEMNPKYKASAACYLCGMHAELHPIQFEWIQGHQIRLSPWEWRRGGRPLDDDFMKIKPEEWIACSSTDET